MSVRASRICMVDPRDRIGAVRWNVYRQRLRVARLRAAFSSMISRGEYTVTRIRAPKSAIVRTTSGSSTHSPEPRSKPACMPMSNSLEDAFAQALRPGGGSSRTNFAKRLIASVGLLGWSPSDSRSQYWRPSLSVCIGTTRFSQAFAMTAGSEFDLMSRSILRNSAGKVSSGSSSEELGRNILQGGVIDNGCHVSRESSGYTTRFTMDGRCTVRGCRWRNPSPTMIPATGSATESPIARSG